MTVSDDELVVCGQVESQLNQPQDLFLEFRHLGNSKLDNHKITLSILKAVEQMISSKQLKGTADDYFLGLWPLLFQSVPASIPAEQVLEWSGAVLNLSSRIIPYCSLNEHYSLVYSGLDQATAEYFSKHAPSAKAIISCLLPVVLAHGEWRESVGDLVRKVLLQGCLDGRPKVRKQAQEAFAEILKAGKMPQEIQEEFLTLLVVCLHESSRKECQSALHLVAFLSKLLLPHLLITKEKELIDGLDYCMGLGNSHLSGKCFEAVQTLAKTSSDPSTLCNLLLKHKPESTVVDVFSQWVIPFAQTAHQHGDKQLVVRALDIIFEAIQTDDPIILTVGKSAVELLLSGASLPSSLGPEDLDRISANLAAKVNVKIFDSFHPATLDICRLTLEAFQSVIVPSFGTLVQLLAILHDKRGFELKQNVEDILSDVCRYVGAETFLQLVPLKLIDCKGRNGWLIGVLSAGVFNDHLAYFKDTLVPIVTRLQQRSQELLKEKPMDSKVYETVANQLLCCVGSFFKCPTDFAMCFDDQFAGYLAKLMTGNVTLRPVICNGLSDLISFVSEDFSDTVLARPVGDKVADLRLLEQYAMKYLPVLFNLCIVGTPDQRSYLLRCIQSFLSISPLQVTCDYLNKLVERLPLVQDNPDQTSALLDIAGSLLSSDQIPMEQLQKLLVYAKEGCLGSSGNIQKRSYRLLCILGMREERLEWLFQNLVNDVLIEGAVKCDSAARKMRFKVLDMMILKDFDVIPSILPEVILGTKEINHHARQEAFDLIIKWGRSFAIAGKLPDYFAMAMAGLAAQTPTMMAASIMALARLLFEFGKDPSVEEIVGSVLDDAITITSSPTKEVVKAAIGLLKVGLGAVPIHMLKSRLPQLLSGLLVWAGEHTQHFKMRVRHCVERLIRMFGYDPVLKVCPQEHYPLLENIKLFKDRKAKRAKNSNEGALAKLEEKQQQVVRKPFDQAMFNSDDDFVGDYEGDEVLAEDDMELVRDDADLESVMSRKLSLKSFKTVKTANTMRSIKSTILPKTSKFQHTQKTTKEEFKLNKSGKMIIKEEDSSDEIEVDAVTNAPELTNDRKKRPKRKHGESDSDEQDYKQANTHVTHLTSLSRKTSLTSRSSLKSSNLQKKKAVKKTRNGDVMKPGQIEPYAYVPLQRAQGGVKQKYFMKSKKH